MSQTQDFLQASFTSRSINKMQYIKRSLTTVIQLNVEYSNTNYSSNMLGHLKKEHAMELGYHHKIDLEYLKSKLEFEIKNQAISSENSKSVLTCIYTNATSLVKKWDSFNSLIQVKNFPHIIMVTETWFNSNTVKNLKDYTLFNKDREQIVGGGVAIYIRNDIDSYETTELSFIDKKIEQCWCNVILLEYIQLRTNHIWVHQKRTNSIQFSLGNITLRNYQELKKHFEQCIDKIMKATNCVEKQYQLLMEFYRNFLSLYKIVNWILKKWRFLIA
ncbi:hypothetical protein BpHYR1_047823 [Brachionus plicatilis]|uniref:RNA-directed DNA polymerase from mobile element jockey-like n=1 Tax=Brachionus plicatilis TaxID=10195 RepID=A0A3M7Q549_BRAPC|nr:hypothetical protein BpHYR1_047823 [Brachionus plicatilis]